MKVDVYTAPGNGSGLKILVSQYFDVHYLEEWIT